MELDRKIWEYVKKNWKESLSILSVISFVTWTIIQLSFLTKYGVLSYFSPTQTLLDSLIIFTYIIIFFIPPLPLILLLTERLDRWIQEGSKLNLGILYIALTTMIIPVLRYCIKQISLWSHPTTMYYFNNLFILWWIFLVSIYTYWAVLHGRQESNIHAKDIIEKLAFKLIKPFLRPWSITAIFIILAWLFIPWLSFDLSWQNIFTNTTFFILISIFIVRIAIPNKHLKKNTHPSVFIILAISLIGMCGYLYQFITHLWDTFNQFWYAVVAKTQREILYKNDIYSILKKSDNPNGIEIIMNENIDVFIPTNYQTQKTYNNVRNRILSTFQLIKGYFKKIAFCE